MDKLQKREVVAELKEQFSAVNSVIVTHYAGIDVADMTELRSGMTKNGASFRVTKNKLAKIALKDTPYEHLSELFTGPVAIAMSSDPVAAAKSVVEFSKENEKLVVLGGGLSEKALDVAAVQALAKLPSLDELRAKILAMLNTPATRIARVSQAPGEQVARVLKAYSEANS